MGDLNKAKIVLPNYQAFQQRETLDTNKIGRAALTGWRNKKLITKETEGETLQRARGELLSLPNIVVLNDEAHHCYRERAGTAEEQSLTGA